MLKRVVVSIYLHPEYYPPTINAINSLSEICEELIVVTNNNSKEDFFIGSNIRFEKLGKYLTPIEFEQKSLPYKILFFLKFTLTFFKYSRSKKTDLILVYDSIPLFSFFLFHKFLKKKTISWFHSHDMLRREEVKKYSIGWFSSKYESKAIQKLSIFSLPTSDRLKYYANIDSRTKYFELPNFPSQKIYNNDLMKEGSDAKQIKIIYQGTIGWGHSIEEILELLNTTINGKELHLTLKGKVKRNYKDSINKLAIQYGVADKLHWIEIGPYREVQNITKEHNIGIAIHLGNIPQGTASNKIYEYAACGLPTLVYDNEQFRKHLGGYEWAVFTDGSVNSLHKAIEFSDTNFQKLSKEAKKDFNTTFFFEKNFAEIKKFLLSNVD